MIRELFNRSIASAARGTESQARFPGSVFITVTLLAALVSTTSAAEPATKKSALNHWAFKAPVKPALPAVKKMAWPANAIDRFILARLEQENLPPSPQADRITLLRRLSLDLIGFPPTPADVDAFLADKSADAYEKQVERLLNSPHYGERWGRHWLDAARYADSDGYEKDKARPIWFYRDWVINAFNRDLPYDQFIIEQFAGDLWPGATQDQIVATGFLRNSMLNEEGAIDPEQFRMEAMFDRMDAIGKAVLGLTIQCAQCHNHKYDPFTQEEYYRLFAFINNDDEPFTAVYLPGELRQRDQVMAGIKRLEAELRARTPDWETRLAGWEEQVRDDQPKWVLLDPIEYLNVGGASRLLLQPDKSMLAAGDRVSKGDWLIRARTPLTNITALRLEMLLNPNLPHNGPGRSFKGTFGLSEFKVEAAPADAPTNKVRLGIKRATADYSQPEGPLEAQFNDKTTNNRVIGPVAFAIDQNLNTAWEIDAGPGQRNQDRKAVFELTNSVGFSGGTELTVILSTRHGGYTTEAEQNNEIGCVRLAVTTQAAPVTADPLPRGVREVLAVPRERRTEEQNAAVFSHWRSIVPEFAAVNERIEQLWKEHPEPHTTLTLHACNVPRDTRVLKRGDWLKPENSVRAGVPGFLHRLPASGSENPPLTRLTFAQWLTDRNSPTTARVFMNRMWQSYFGAGLVSTPEDLGTQSDPPSHRELLDWLACEFMDRGWRVKEMHRLIVHSATYRQTSTVTPELAAGDPQDRLLARVPRLRVEGEVVRDIALFASGLLTPTIGGPSVLSPLPESLKTLSFAALEWEDATGADRYRRALYTFRRRSTPYPSLQNFDAPNGDASCVRRARSNTPLQALTTLNETLFLECARGLAKRIVEQGGDSDESRLAYAFRLCVARPPTERERASLLQLLRKQQQRLADGWLNPWLMAGARDQAPDNLPASANPSRLAAYTVVARVLLNLDETITRE